MRVCCGGASVWCKVRRSWNFPAEDHSSRKHQTSDRPLGLSKSAILVSVDFLRRLGKSGSLKQGCCEKSERAQATKCQSIILVVTYKQIWAKQEEFSVERDVKLRCWKEIKEVSCQDSRMWTLTCVKTGSNVAAGWIKIDKKKRKGKWSRRKMCIFTSDKDIPGHVRLTTRTLQYLIIPLLSAALLVVGTVGIF